jgi:hypothetical protein
MSKFTLNFISNSKVGDKHVYSQIFVALPQGSGHAPFQRLDALKNAKVMSAGRRIDPLNPQAADAASEGWVEVDLPNGAILKTLSADARMPAFKGKVHSTRIVRSGSLVDIPCEGTGRANDGMGTLKTIVVLDGKRIFV